MKTLSQYITEYLIKKKVDKVCGYKYAPKTKKELIANIKELLDKGETDLNCINVSNITDMSGLFYILYIVDKDIDISYWNVSNVENMENMFFGCKKFDCDLSNWNVRNVKNMTGMFNCCDNFTGKGLENWNVSNVKYMSYMFSNCENFTGKGLENWDVSNVQYMRLMFCNCKKLNVDLSKWNVKKARLQLTRMFYGCASLKNIPHWYKE